MTLYTVQILRNNETVYEVSFTSFRKAESHFNKIVEVETDNPEIRHSISSVKEGMMDQVQLLRGRFVDTFVLI